MFSPPEPTLVPICQKQKFTFGCEPEIPQARPYHPAALFLKAQGDPPRWEGVDYSIHRGASPHFSFQPPAPTSTARCQQSAQLIDRKVPSVRRSINHPAGLARSFFWGCQRIPPPPPLRPRPQEVVRKGPSTRPSLAFWFPQVTPPPPARCGSARSRSYPGAPWALHPARTPPPPALRSEGRGGGVTLPPSLHLPSTPS